MKPKIGEKVYRIWQYQIYLETVGYLGSESFIIEDYSYKDDVEYEYSDYGKVWFRDLEKAKKVLRKKFPKKAKVIIEQANDEVWEAYEEDEQIDL